MVTINLQSYYSLLKRQKPVDKMPTIMEEPTMIIRVPILCPSITVKLNENWQLSDDKKQLEMDYLYRYTNIQKEIAAIQAIIVKYRGLK